jgi:membrane protease YdiL (CAAX protease family)
VPQGEPHIRQARASGALEILLVFVVAFVVIAVGWRLVGEDPFARQVVVWVANVLMLLTIWLALRRRGQTWAHLGLRFRPGGPRAIGRAVLQSLAVVVVALAAFILASMLTRGLATGAAAADTGGYDYLRGNLPMLILALAAVYVVSSFGEEVVYRGFLMTRVAEMDGGTRRAWGAAILVGAVVFGLAHFGWGLIGIIQTTFMGLALGAAYLIVKRNLWVLVLAHAYMDTALLVQVYLGPSPPAP